MSQAIDHHEYSLKSDVFSNGKEGIGPLVVLIFIQMLPATMLTPAIRPLFAANHSGKEWAMHAFMAINMAGAALLVPLIGACAGRMKHPRKLLALLALADALLMQLVIMPLPVLAVLALRAVEGIAHVGGTTILLAEASQIGREQNNGKAMGMAGAAIIFAVAVGNALGGVSVSLSPVMPFWIASALFLTVAAAAFRSPKVARSSYKRESAATVLLGSYKELWFPLGAAFVERFAVGCIVVTLSLFAHKAHKLSDGSIGWLFALMTFPFALSMYPMARLSCVFPRSFVLAVGGVLYSSSIFMIGQIPAAGLPFVMIFAGVGASMIFATTLCYASTLVSAERRAAAMALINAAGCLGMLMGPAFAGIASALFKSAEDPFRSYRTVFALAACSIFAWLLVGAGWLRRRFSDETNSFVSVPAAHNTEEA